MGQTFRSNITILEDILAEVVEIDGHIHNYESAFGLAAVPAGETHRADELSSLPFQVVAGNNTWGTWLQILGSDDTPFRAGNTKFDLSFLHVMDSNDAGIYKIQIACGDSGAAALAAGNYTEVYYKRGAANNTAFQTRILDKRRDIGSKYWMRIWLVGGNGKTIDFMLGLHEYLV